MSKIDPVQQYGRIRRLANRYCWAVKTQLDRIERTDKLLLQDQNTLNRHQYTMKNDWEALGVFLVRLRRCLSLLDTLKPAISIDPSYAQQFDELLPSLSALRNFEEHWDDYSCGRGRNKEADWGHLESYSFGPIRFENGVGAIPAKDAFDASLIAWEAVLSVGEQAKELGYLTWDDRYGPEGKFRRTA